MGGRPEGRYLGVQCCSGGHADPALLPAFQFSGPSAEQMRKTYSEFCSRHTKALKLYKELFARDKRFQQFIRVSGPPQDPRPAPFPVLACCACVRSGSAHRAPHGSRARAFQREVRSSQQACGVCPRFPDDLP